MSGMPFLTEAPCEIANHPEHWPLKGWCFGGSVSEGPLPSAAIFVGSVEILDVRRMLAVCASLPGPVAMLSLRWGVNIGSGRFLSRCVF